LHGGLQALKPLFLQPGFEAEPAEGEMQFGPLGLQLNGPAEALMGLSKVELLVVNQPEEVPDFGFFRSEPGRMAK
jgi:hypothetical protein